MSTSPEQLQYLLLQYANNNCTRQELLSLLHAMEEAGHNEVLHHSLLHMWQNISDSDQLPAIDKEELFSNIMAAVPEQPSRRAKYTWLKIAAAAMLVLALGTLAYMYVSKNEAPQQKGIVQLAPFKNEKAAQIGKAILSLAGGEDIILDDAPIGTLARQGHTTIFKRNNRQLVYTIDADAPEGEQPQYNILTTPPGLQYDVVLPDESHVWVNAATAMRFPTAFTGNERSVALTGEAYFEVAPLTLKGEKKKMPFIVNVLSPSGATGGGRIEVLGTHFNIKAYDQDEDIQTTLLEGRVKVSAMPARMNLSDGVNGQWSILKPGQQAAIHDSRLTIHNDINVNEVIAWKRGELIFNNLTMAQAASVIERWYNVQVDIKKPRIANCRITVSFLKGETIQQVMDVMGAYDDFTWKMKNNTITLSGKGCD